MDLTVETFQGEIQEALENYDRFIVCLDKSPEDCKASLVSLMNKAIGAYVTRGPQLRHGIALDKQVTIILSQTDQDRPLCGIYFNLHSPYKKKVAGKAKKEDLIIRRSEPTDMIHPKAVHPWVTFICIMWVYLAIYMVWVISLFQPRKDGSQRRWRSQDWMWVPLAGITGAVLLALWWHMRPSP